MGTGHIMRCLTLADALREKGAEVAFICRELPGNLCALVEQKGYKVYQFSYSFKKANTVGPEKNGRYSDWLGVNWRIDAEQTRLVLLKQKVSWIITDHYALDKKWESIIKQYVKKIMVIDDLANRPHDCDLLLDQNLSENPKDRYKDLVPENCKMLLGPEHALIRSEFYETRKKLKKRNGTIKNILIFFGGSDPTNETQKALQAIKTLNKPNIKVSVVIGNSNLHKGKIEKMCSDIPHTFFHCQVDNMAQLMMEADLAIGAGGITTWERCFLGLPTIIVIVADNQVQSSVAVSKAGIAWNLGRKENVGAYDIQKAIERAFDNPDIVKQMSDNALKLTSNKINSNNVTVIESLMG